MRKYLKNKLNDDYLDFVFCTYLACFLLLTCGSWFIGLLLESENSATFLLMVSFGGVLCGILCGFNCIYLLTGKVYKITYYIMISLGLIGYVLAIIGQAIYETS